MLDPRRQHPRVSCVLPVRLIIRTKYQLIETLTKNLSLGGFRCLSPVDKSIGTPLSIELCLGVREEPLITQGRIAWIESVPQSEQFYVGVAFSILSERNTVLVSTYLKNIVQRTPHKIV